MGDENERVSRRVAAWARRVAVLGALIVAVFAVGGCGGDDDDDGGDDGAAAAERWEGRFESTFGEISFEADGDQVTGSYDYCGGSLDGTASGSRLTGDWTEDPQACGPGERRATDAEPTGTFDFTLASDGASFTGNWRYASGAEDQQGDNWEGERVSDTP